MFFRKYVIPALAVAGASLAVYTVASQSHTLPAVKPPAEPARSPFAGAVAGAGLVEASTQNIAIGTPVGGVVWGLHVKVGDRVKAGAPLFLIDDRVAKAEVENRRAALQVAEQNVARLRAEPRPEDIPPAEARFVAAEASYQDMQTQLALWESVTDRRAIAQDEFRRRQFAVAIAQANAEQAKAELLRLKAGAWAPDVAIAGAQVESARAALAAAQTELDRHTVRAPVDAQVLQVNIRPGEFAPAGAQPTPLMLIGGTEVLHVRVDVDENDAWRVRPDAPARAAVRGNSSLQTPLRFVRIEPYVVPKRSLTGESTERVDTRVLQVLYAFDPGSLPVYVGQQMDVFIEDTTAGRSPAGAPDQAKNRPR